MFINKDAKDLLPIKNLDSFYVVADFDRTITSGSSKTSWSILADSDLVSKSYVEERQNLYNRYRPIEIDENIDFNLRSLLIKEWFQKHIDLFIKYQLSEDIFNIAATNLRVMEFRQGAKEFLEFLYKHNIPLIIISAGIGNFIEAFLRHNNCYFNNIYISSNKILFKNGIAVGVGENIIHSLNKNEVSLPDNVKDKLSNRNQVILLGDQIGDLKMVNENAHDTVLSIGFVADDCQSQVDTLKAYFDIVCEQGDDYHKLKELLFN